MGASIIPSSYRTAVSSNLAMARTYLTCLCASTWASAASRSSAESRSYLNCLSSQAGPTIRYNRPLVLAHVASLVQPGWTPDGTIRYDDRSLLLLQRRSSQVGRACQVLLFKLL